MFNLSMKQVHNLLRSTYCHWPGPAITWNHCFGNQLIWAMTLGGRRWRDHQEEKAGGGILCAGSALSHSYIKPFGRWPQSLELALPGCSKEVQPASSTAAMCIAGWLWLCFSHQAQKLFFLPRHSRSSVTGGSWDCPPKTMKLPTTSPLLFPAPSAEMCAEESLAHNW